MMRILIVEDEPSKERKIKQFLSSQFSVELDVVRSVISAKLKLKEKNDYDFVLLDMTLPLYDNDDLDYIDDNEFEPFGGESILDEIERLCIVTKVIIITAFDVLGDGAQHIDLESLSNRIKHEFPQLFIGSVFYNSTSTRWKEELKVLLIKEQ